MDVAEAHPEFFRVFEGKDGRVASLVARHVTRPRKDAEEEGKVLGHGFVAELIKIAVEIHGAQVQRKQVYWAVGIGGVLLFLGTLASIASAIAPLIRR